MLRGLVLSRHDAWDPFNVFDIVDDRTLRAFLKRCGLNDGEVPTLDSFLRKQRLIERGNLIAVVHALRCRGIDVPSAAVSDELSRQMNGLP